ncbi:hypothetical protein [Kitasatospora sp. P5_F3]
MDERESAGQGASGSTGRLLRTVRADPRHMPERMAVFAVEFLGTRAAESVAQLRARRAADPEADTGEPAVGVIRRGVHRAVVEGAFLGGPFMVLLPIAFCAALLAQLRMVLELAALAGRDPRDQDMAADLLVIQGVYPDVAQAEVALREAERAPTDDGTRAGWWSTVRRQAYLLGLLVPEEQPRGGLRKAAGWAGLTVLLLVGLVVPFVWVPACGEMYRRSTNQLAERAIAYFALDRDTETEPSAKTRFAVRPGAVLVALRTLGACILTVGTVLVVFLADLRIADNSWGTGVLLLLAAAAVVSVVWYRRRR